MNFRALSLTLLLLPPMSGVGSAFDLEFNGPRLTVRGFTGGMRLTDHHGDQIYFKASNGTYRAFCAAGRGGGTWPSYCPYGMPGSTNDYFCPTEADAIALFYARFVGRTMVLPAVQNQEPIIEYACLTWPGGPSWYIREDSSSPPPASCSASGGDIHLSGIVGEHLKGSASWRVQCDKRTDVRMTIEGNGDVPLDGGGAVNLRFRESGRSVLEIDSDTPAMNIDGELRTALPAGVYRGAAIIKLDVI